VWVLPSREHFGFPWYTYEQPNMSQVTSGATLSMRTAAFRYKYGDVGGPVAYFGNECQNVFVLRLTHWNL